MMYLLLVVVAVRLSGIAATDGGWSEWTPIHKCTDTCGGGVQLRKRACDNPKPTRKGKSCVGNKQDVRMCNSQACPVTEVAGWGDWQSWYECPVTCGGGVQLRERSCDSPAPSAKGDYCVGIQKETQMCNPDKCTTVTVVDGGWSGWTDWTKCSVICGKGVKLRERTCSNPRPSATGRNCVGDHKEVQMCSALTECGQCYISGRVGSYWGTVSHTKTGIKCQNWHLTEPHTPSGDNYPNLLADFCRVLGELTPWCYTTNPDKRWEFCDVPECGSD